MQEAVEVKSGYCLPEDLVKKLGLWNDDFGTWRVPDGRTLSQMIHRKSVDEPAFYWVETFGCQMNERDSETIAGELESIGYQPAASVDCADAIVVNTCCVRESAERKVYSRLGNLAQLKRNNPCLLIAVGGCMPQQSDVAEELKKKMPYVDVIFGTYNVAKVGELIIRAAVEGRVVVDVAERLEVKEGVPTRRRSPLKAFVNISFGCDNFCTYCIVPYVRGKQRSRLPEAILAEVEELARQGCKEITLLGQNVNAYGKDLNGSTRCNFGFGDLLKELNKVEGIERIRYTTSHPRDFGYELVRTVAECSKVCENFHLPVQAGSNRILKRMNRGYTREQYLELVNLIREVIPKSSITTDLIVGFPGETEEDFAQTVELVKQVKFDSAFMFMYSPRKGTPAAKLKDQLPLEVKKARLSKLIAVQQDISLSLSQALVGGVEEVLVEGPSERNPEVLVGRSRTNRVVHFSGGNELIGKLVNVKILSAHTWTLFGELI